MIRQSRLAEAGLPPGTPYQVLPQAGYDVCIYGQGYGAPTRPYSLYAAWSDTGHTLQAVYHARKRQAYFIPTTVLGYPAVFAGPHDWRSTGQCTLNVGVSDQWAFAVTMQTGGSLPKRESCSIAGKAAAVIVANIRKYG